MLVETKLPLELLDRRGLRRAFDDGVGAFALLAQIVGEPALAPALGLADLPAQSLQILHEPIEKRHDLLVGGSRIDDYQGLVRIQTVHPLSSNQAFESA